MQPARHSDFLPYLLNRVVSQFNVPMQKMLRKRAMTLTHWRILGILDESDGLTISELSERTVTDLATLSRALDRLEERAMIRRATDETDSRQFRVHLLAPGRSEYREIAAHAMTVQAWAFRGMSDQQLAQLRQSLAGLSAAMADYADTERGNADATQPASQRSQHDKVPG